MHRERYDFKNKNAEITKKTTVHAMSGEGAACKMAKGHKGAAAG